MPETMTEVQAPSATPEPTPNLEIPRRGTPEYQTWRETGDIPAKAKPVIADSATADTPKEESEDSTDSAVKDTQEQRATKRKPDVEERFKTMTAELKRLSAELEEARKPKDQKTETKAPQTYQDWRKTFKPTAWVENFAKENPDATYEDANAAMADHLGDVRDQFRTFEQARSKQQSELNSKISEAKKRYENFDDTTGPFVNAFVGDAKIPASIKEMVDESPVFADLAFTLAGDDKFMEMARTEPAKAKRYIANIERGIEEQLSGKGGEEPTDRNDKGQFTKPAPVKRGPEHAPEPPLEVGTRGAGPKDGMEAALKAIESGDSRAFGRWKAEEDAKDLRRRRGE